MVWNRANDPARQNVAPGMGVRFDKLTPDAERVLSRILAEKDRRGDAQKGSRFDDGIRAQAGETTEAPAPAPAKRHPRGNMFGDEPTRAMAADQVNRLAESIKAGVIEEDQPTRRGTAADSLRRSAPHHRSQQRRQWLATGHPRDFDSRAQKLPAMQPMQQMQPMQPIKSPMACAARCLAGGLAWALGSERTAGKPRAGQSRAGRWREPSSSGIKAAQIPIPESAVTPVKAADAASVAEPANSDRRRRVGASAEQADPGHARPQHASCAERSCRTGAKRSRRTREACDPGKRATVGSRVPSQRAASSG